jgi:flagellar biosynthesis protein FliQ
MTEELVLDMSRQALLVVLSSLGPIVLTALVIGFGVAIFQAVTQLNEPTLTFMPKIIGIALVLMLLGPLMMDRFLAFTQSNFEAIAFVLR